MSRALYVHDAEVEDNEAASERSKCGFNGNTEPALLTCTSVTNPDDAPDPELDDQIEANWRCIEQQNEAIEELRRRLQIDLV